MGLGRTYASAARNPGLFESSAEVAGGADEIEGVEREARRFVGDTSDLSRDFLVTYFGWFWDSDTFEPFLEPFEGAVGVNGNGLSSSE